MAAILGQKAKNTGWTRFSSCVWEREREKLNKWSLQSKRSDAARESSGNKTFMLLIKNIATAISLTHDNYRPHFLHVPQTNNYTHG